MPAKIKGSITLAGTAEIFSTTGKNQSAQNLGFL